MIDQFVYPLNLNPTSITRLKQLWEESSDTLIVTHYNPDGDAIGSALALFHLLTNMGKSAKVMIPNELPDFLKWLPGSEQVFVYQQDPNQGDVLLENAEVIVCLDFNTFSRVKLFTEKLASAKGKRVLIDHHTQPDRDFEVIFSEIEVSSTSELLYDLIKKADLLSFTDQNFAYCIYVGVMTDTGSYSFSCNRPDTYHITAELLHLGVDAEKAHRLVYDTYTEQRMRLLGFCLSERLKVFPEYSTAYIWLTKEDLNKFNYQQGDTEGIVNYALSIQNITMGALFTERDDRIRISLRSKGEFSVNELARIHFQGGGHKNAAGADSNLTMHETLQKFEGLLEGYQSDLEKNRINTL